MPKPKSKSKPEEGPAAGIEAEFPADTLSQILRGIREPGEATGPDPETAVFRCGAQTLAVPRIRVSEAIVDLEMSIMMEVTGLDTVDARDRLLLKLLAAHAGVRL